MNLQMHFGTTIAAGTLAAEAVQAFLAAAALHLGEADTQGRRLEAPKARSAWLAILAAEAVSTVLSPFLAPEESSELGRQLGGLVSLFAARYPDHQAPVPELMVMRIAREGRSGVTAPPPIGAFTRAAGPYVEPVDVDALVHTFFQALLAVAGDHLGESMASGDRLGAPDADEAALCLRLAGALHGQLVMMLSGEARELWSAMLLNKLDQWEDVPQTAAPVSSLRATIEAATGILAD